MRKSPGSPRSIADEKESDVTSVAPSIDDGATSDGCASDDTCISSDSSAPQVACGAHECRFDIIVCRSGCYTLADWRRMRWERWQTSHASATVWDRRRQLLACATNVFHVSELSQPKASVDAVREGLHTLQKFVGSLVFGHDRKTCPYSEPPEELFTHPTDDELWDQYQRLKDLIRKLRKDFPGRYARVSEVVEVLVKNRAGSVKKVGARDLNVQSLRREISDGHEYEYVQSRKHGEVQVLQRICKDMDHQMHGLLMTLEYTAVSNMWHIWHILRMYHRATMWSMSSEAIAEHVGSLIRYTEKKHSACRALDVPALVRAARLRAAGLRGDNSDAPFYHASNVAPCSEEGRYAYFFLARPRPKGTSA